MTERDLARAEDTSILARLARAAARMRADLPLAGLDLLLLSIGYLSVLAFRFDGAVPESYWTGFLLVFLPTALLTHLSANTALGLYGKVWRHASVDEARRVVLAGGASTGLLSVGFLLLAPNGRIVPASVVILGGALALLLTGVLRFQARLLSSHRRQADKAGSRVLVVGAGSAGSAVIRDMLTDPASTFTPVAILDDDPRKAHRDVAGVPVVGDVDDLPEAAALFDVDLVLLAMPSAQGETIREIAAAADAEGLPVKTVPRLSELASGDVGLRDVRDLEIADLLGREQIPIDLAAVREALRDRRVLVTGAGGSIGREIARQVAESQPAALVLVDHDETHLHDAAALIDGEATQALADIRDRSAVEDLFLRHRPEVVFHAAAHKHVPLLESHPWEAVQTNVRGSEHVLDAAARHDVERLVFISTDKAVEPSSVMGATKRLGEHLLRMYAPQDAAWCAVRFGNVLGSRGSVIPTFMRQIAEGGPVTVTDPRMERFFMSIEEAVRLVLQAGALAEDREVFMLDMGEPVRIADLAERMIRLSGRRVGEDIEIVYTGLRPGEKLAEVLANPNEIAHATGHPAIVSLSAGRIDLTVAERLADLYQAAEARNEDAIREMLFGLLPKGSAAADSHTTARP